MYQEKKKSTINETVKWTASLSTKEWPHKSIKCVKIIFSLKKQTTPFSFSFNICLQQRTA